MTWDTYRAVRASVNEFSAQSGLREAHHFVRLPSGRWTRTLGVPGLIDGQVNELHLRHRRGRVWTLERVTP